MRFIIVTGMSGAGKTTALKVLEDLGYFCVDNLPIPLMDKFAELTLNGNSDIERVALGIDIRNGKNLAMMESILEGITMKHIKYEILFFISCIVLSGVIAILEYTSYNDSILSLNMVLGNWITAYLVRICCYFNKYSYFN